MFLLLQICSICIDLLMIQMCTFSFINSRSSSTSLYKWFLLFVRFTRVCVAAEFVLISQYRFHFYMFIDDEVINDIQLRLMIFVYGLVLLSTTLVIVWNRLVITDSLGSIYALAFIGIQIYSIIQIS